MGKIIGICGIKGGVGKSTTANMLQSRLGDERSVIFSIDLTQDPEEFNSGNTLNLQDVLDDADFSVEDMTSGKAALEILMYLKEEYDYVIVDTPGQRTPEVTALFYNKGEIMDYSIAPVRVGGRSSKSTVYGFQHLIEYDLFDINKELFVVFNETPSDIFEEEKVEMCKNFEEILGMDTSLITFASLPSSRAMRTMENGFSIDDLSLKNKIAYKKFKQRADELTDKLLEFIGEK